MGTPVTAYKVENMSKVDTTKYKEGDVFISNRSGGMLINGRIRIFNSQQGLKKSDVQKMIDETIKKGGVNNE